MLSRTEQLAQEQAQDRAGEHPRQAAHKPSGAALDTAVDRTTERTIDRTVDRAIERAQAYMLDRQLASGAWVGTTIAGPGATAEALVALAYAGALDGHDAEKARHWLARRQLDDGSFEVYEDQHQDQGADRNRGKLDQTAIVYAALIAAGEDPDSRTARQAWHYIGGQGGFSACELYTKILVAAAGIIDPRELPDWPLEWVLAPGVDRQLGSRLAPAFTFMLHTVPAIIRGLRARRTPKWQQFVASATRRRMLAYLQAHQNPTGNFFGACNTTVLGILCYRALGITPDDARLMRAIDDMAQWRVDEDGALRFATFDSQVWHTALMLGALCDSGMDAGHPAVHKALHFLVTRQSFWALPPDWQNPTLGTPRTGGWAFEDRNPLASDNDSTGVVLGALGRIRDPDSRVQHAIHRGLRWLFGMQNADGGWASFARGQRGKEPGPFALSALEQPDGALGNLRMLATPPVQFRDPSTADLTGRVLQGLGRLGHTTSNKRVARAIAFLRAQQTERGIWWGRWECNYLAGSAEVVRGLASVGADMSMYIRAIDWIKARQNPDGGWGETVDSYENLALAGRGESNAYSTGIVTTALIESGHRGAPEVERAVRHMLERQQPDGTWPETGYQFTVQWPWPYYRLVHTATIYPLLALTAYRSRSVVPHEHDR